MPTLDDPRVFFTEPQYDGYAAVQVRLAEVDPEMLGTLVTEAWRVRAPRRLPSAAATR